MPSGPISYHPPLDFGSLGLAAIALDAATASEKTLEMDEGAAGAVQQAVRRAVEAIGVGQFDPANPTRIEQLLFA